jgi:hypothetical protein
MDRKPKGNKACIGDNFYSYKRKTESSKTSVIAIKEALWRKLKTLSCGRRFSIT